MSIFPLFFGVREICVFISCGFIFSFWLLVKMLARFDPPPPPFLSNDDKNELGTTIQQ